MDDARKQNILSHIDKIDQYARQPGNEWLLEELQRRFGTMSNMTELKHIEKYLALDFSIDDISTRIDYSFIKDDLLRMKLVSDWREMLRYRCHVRKHKPDFLEFCRFAYMQVEGSQTIIVCKSIRLLKNCTQRVRSKTRKQSHSGINCIFYNSKILSNMLTKNFYIENCIWFAIYRVTVEAQHLVIS